MEFRTLCFLILGMEVCQIPDRNMGGRDCVCQVTWLPSCPEVSYFPCFKCG